MQCTPMQLFTGSISLGLRSYVKAMLGGPTPAEYETLKAERDALASELLAAKQAISELQTKVTEQGGRGILVPGDSHDDGKVVETCLYVSFQPTFTTALVCRLADPGDGGSSQVERAGGRAGPPDPAHRDTRLHCLTTSNAIQS